MHLQSSMAVPEHHKLSPIEACIGVPWGTDLLSAGLPAAERRDPRAAFEASVLTALQRSPCLVTFSGGRDSSAVLAVATKVARSHGLADPVPVTNRFPTAARSNEDEWQEDLVAHLKLTDWVKLSWTDELDLVGPIATRVLDRHGPLFPCNAHFMDPLLEKAAGGSLLTGLGGDELFGPTDRPVLARLVYGRELPRVRELRALALQLAPRSIRSHVYKRRSPYGGFKWLRPDVRKHVVNDYARKKRMPLRWDRSIEHLWRGRYIQCVIASHRAMSAAHDVQLISPFCEPQVLATFRQTGGPLGPGDRASALLALFGDVLPDLVLRRTTKAAFDEVFVGRHTRSFAHTWAGSGVDTALVDVNALRDEWLAPLPAANAFTLMHHAWLAEHGAPVSQRGVPTEAPRRTRPFGRSTVGG